MLPTSPRDHVPHTPDSAESQQELSFDELPKEISLAEAAATLGARYPEYLAHMCRKYGKPSRESQRPADPAHALRYAEALVATCPDEDEGYEIRAYCRAQLTPLDYTALLADYNWLARYYLRGPGYWAGRLAHLQDGDPEHYNFMLDRATQEDRYRRTHFALASAWAYYRLRKRFDSGETFQQAFQEPARPDFGFDPEWPVNLLPPVPDPEYLDWQINRQLARRPLQRLPPIMQDWIVLASQEYVRLTPPTA